MYPDGSPWANERSGVMVDSPRAYPSHSTVFSTAGVPCGGPSMVPDCLEGSAGRFVLRLDGPRFGSDGPITSSVSSICQE